MSKLKSSTNMEKIENIWDFEQTLKVADSDILCFDELKTLQINLGDMCNQNCDHCHVQAGPNGKKIMPKSVMEKIVAFLQKRPGLTVDVTGGSPELNPHFKFFMENLYPVSSSLLVRTNLTVFFEDGLGWLPGWYRDHKVVVIASLPCYTAENVDSRRGAGVFEKSIKALRILNESGYGRSPDLELDLVYNPGEDFLPSSQKKLEADYKKQLLENYGVRFNHLFTMINAPIGRFKCLLESTGRLDKYMQLLRDNFNAGIAENIMCRTLISVDYQGVLYNCDFNQALRMPIADAAGDPVRIEQIEESLEEGVEILTGGHCFCCTAGAGSSCTGALAK